MLKSILKTGTKVLILAILAAVITLIVSGVAATSATQAADPNQAGAALIGILLVSLVDVLMLLLVIIRLSSWAGWPLTIGLAIAYFGVKTFIGQIEVLAFLTPMASEIGAGTHPITTMPIDIILGQFFIGIALALIIVPLAVRWMGKNRKSAGETGPRLTPAMNLLQWLWKLLAVIVIYQLLYFGFGYYVAWQSPAVLEFYQGTDPGSFLAQMQNALRFTPLLIPFQALRALLWMAFAMPVIMMLRKREWTGALVTAIFLAIPMNIQHIIPNPFMPVDVRMVHFIETAS